MYMRHSSLIPIEFASVEISQQFYPLYFDRETGKFRAQLKYIFDLICRSSGSRLGTSRRQKRNGPLPVCQWGEQLCPSCVHRATIIVTGRRDCPCSFVHGSSTFYERTPLPIRIKHHCLPRTLSLLVAR